jgi:hypothetical protein
MNHAQSLLDSGLHAFRCSGCGRLAGRFRIVSIIVGSRIRSASGIIASVIIL